MAGVTDLEKKNAWVSFMSAALCGHTANPENEEDTDFVALAVENADEALEEFEAKFDGGRGKPRGRRRGGDGE